MSSGDADRKAKDKRDKNPTAAACQSANGEHETNCAGD